MTIVVFHIRHPERQAEDGERETIKKGEYGKSDKQQAEIMEYPAFHKRKTEANSKDKKTKTCSDEAILQQDILKIDNIVSPVLADPGIHDTSGQEGQKANGFENGRNSMHSVLSFIVHVLSNDLFLELSAALERSEFTLCNIWL